MMKRNGELVTVSRLPVVVLLETSLVEVFSLIVATSNISAPALRPIDALGAAT
jgi:hypothetical protein